MRYARLAGAALLLVLAVPALLASPSPSADVSSSQALGLGELTETARGDERGVETLFASPAALRTEPDAGLVLLPGVPGSLAPGEVRSLEHHLAPEGRIWVLDETGGSNDLVEPAGVRVLPDPLLDPSSPYGDARFVEAQARVGNETYEILLSSPALLEVEAERASVLARAQDAVRDVDRSGEIEETDPSGDHPVIATVNVGDRRVLVASDAGWLTNTVLRDGNYDNAALLETLLAEAPEGDLVIDASRHDPARALAPVKTLTQGLLWLATNWLALGATAAGVAGGTVLAVRRAPEREDVEHHDHDVGRVRRPDPGAAGRRLRHVLVGVVSSEGTEDPSDLLALDEEELAREAQRVLGTKEYLNNEADMGHQFRNLRDLLRQGGPSS